MRLFIVLKFTAKVINCLSNISLHKYATCWQLHGQKRPAKSTAIYSIMCATEKLPTALDNSWMKSKIL